jgi:23S rRNA (cytidine1920-2'-O)/16S rRNA (cytidine1409-2'-O)-methyltransferase
MARRHHRRFVRLVDRLQVESITQAVAVIVAGQVTVNGLIVTNPDAMVAVDAVVALVAERVLRGTLKLRQALDRFRVPISGRVCLDVGAAAGGFTAALLASGASKVYAVDVGYGQLAGRFRQDRRVVNLERTNLADLTTGLVPDVVEVICLDLSYLALTDAIPQLASLELSETAQLIALVKPTFELHASSIVVEREAVDKAVAAVVVAAEGCDWSMGARTAEVLGGGGALEVFVYGTRRSKGEVRSSAAAGRSSPDTGAIPFVGSSAAGRIQLGTNGDLPIVRGRRVTR